MDPIPLGPLRVSDADRDRAVAELSEHFQAGRLTIDELQDRTGQALAARTGQDLARLFTDLPRSQATGPGTQAPAIGAPAPAAGSRPVPAARILVTACAVVLVVSIVASLRTGFGHGVAAGHPLVALVPVLAVVLVVRALFR